MKYEKELLKIITSELQSTNSIREQLSSEIGRSVNWLSLIRWLEEIQRNGKIVSTKLSRIIFWKLK